MDLAPQERDRLLLFLAAELARARRARGLRLNVPEATALVADAVCEAARDGARHADAVAAGGSVLTVDDVLPGVADVLDVVQVEAVFDDGSRLVCVRDPVAGPRLGPEAPGAVLPGAGRDRDGAHADVRDRWSARDRVPVVVVNEAAVPVAVTSHFHFFEVNPRLRFDRAAAYGRRLDLASGQSVRFDPGEPVTVELVPIGGDRVVVGFAGLVDGPLDAPGARERALAALRECGFADTGDTAAGTAASDGVDDSGDNDRGPGPDGAAAAAVRRRRRQADGDPS
ncbi:MAG: urease subunit gamma [Candidatus Nanopelagicales bacterium]